MAVNGFQASAGYGQGSTTATVASAIASVFNNSGSSPVNASVSGAALTLTSKQMGSSANYPLTWGASTNLPGTVSQPSFSVSVANLTSGKNAGTAPGTIYNYSVAYAPNGDVLTANDAANGNWTYAYDAFNRLLTAASSNTGLGCDWVYDRFGNRLQQNPYNGSCGTPQYTSSGGNNRMDGYSYDAAGNLTTDSNNNTYTYDAENRISQVGPAGSTATYGYDAAGQRVRKTSSAGTVDYIYDLAGHEVAEVSSAGAWNRGEVYAGGRHLATYDGGTTYFNHADWLGTERARSQLSAIVCEQIVSLPFGDGTAITSSCVSPDPSPMHFTGKQRDAETGLDDFDFRYYGSSMGRFMSPDDDSAEQPSNPQSWNPYSYVMNRPTVATDPDGHDCIYQDPDSGRITGFNRGDCDNSTTEKANAGIYVDGTVTSASYDSKSQTLNFTFNPYDGGAGVGAITGVPAPQPPAGMDNGAISPGMLGPGDLILFSGVKLPSAVTDLFGKLLGSILGKSAEEAAETAAKIVPDVDNLSNKIVRQMVTRGWTKQEILDTVNAGKAFPVINKATGGAATEYVSVGGKFVVVDNATRQVIQVSGPGFLPNH